MRRLSYSPRPATEADLDQVHAIELQSISPPWTRAAFAAELEKGKSRFWALTDNETDSSVLAYIVFSFPAEQAHIVTLAVKPELRRQGLGAFLLRRAIDYVFRKKGESVVLELRKGNKPALQLYQALGFIVIHTMPAFYPDGEDGLSMILRLDQFRVPDADSDEADGDDEEAALPQGKRGKSYHH